MNELNAEALKTPDQNEFETAEQFHQTIKDLMDIYADSNGNINLDVDVDGKDLAMAIKLLDYLAKGEINDQWQITPAEKKFLEAFAGKE